MVRIATHFYGIDFDDKYSRIAAKLLQRKYHDPYPLTHVCLQVDKLFIAYLGKHFIVTKSLPKPKILKFSYTINAAIEDACRILHEYRKLVKDYPCNFSMASYFKPGVPWCTDFIKRILFNYQGGYLQQPPYELLDDFICSDKGTFSHAGNTDYEQ